MKIVLLWSLKVFITVMRYVNLKSIELFKTASFRTLMVWCFNSMIVSQSTNILCIKENKNADFGLDQGIQTFLLTPNNFTLTIFTNLRDIFNFFSSSSFSLNFCWLSTKIISLKNWGKKTTKYLSKKLVCAAILNFAFFFCFSDRRRWQYQNLNFTRFSV